MKKLICVLGFLSFSVYAQGQSTEVKLKPGESKTVTTTVTEPTTVNTTVVCQKDCSKPKPKPTPSKPKPKPQCPQCPTVKCVCPVPKEDTKEKEIVYVDKEVSTYQPHSLSLLLGRGPDGVYTELEKKPDVQEYRFYKDKGAFVGLMYQYQFAPNWAVGAGYLSTDSLFGIGTFKWGSK